MFQHKIDLTMIDATSKLSMKLSCLRACNNDVSRAEQLYGFLACDGLPETDPIIPSALERVKSSADGILGWISEHREDISRGVSLVQSIRSGKAAPVATPPVQPIPDV